MNTEVTTPKTFEEKLKDKVRDSIGDLISDEDLTKIVNRTMEEVFFKPRMIKDTNYPYKDVAHPPFIHVLVKELLQPSVDKATKEFFDNNKEEVLKAISTVMENGIGACVLNAINNQFNGQLITLQHNILNQLNQSR